MKIKNHTLYNNPLTLIFVQIFMQLSKQLNIMHTTEGDTLMGREHCLSRTNLACVSVVIGFPSSQAFCLALHAYRNHNTCVQVSNKQKSVSNNNINNILRAVGEVYYNGQENFAGSCRKALRIYSFFFFNTFISSLIWSMILQQ